MELVGEGGINEVDEECIREQGDHLIVRIGRGDMIRSTRQGIWSTEILARYVFECEVKLREVKQPSSLATIQIMRLAEVSQVFVVHKDPDRSGGTEKVVAPSIQGSHDSKQLLVIDVIVAFSRAERLG